MNKIFIPQPKPESNTRPFNWVCINSYVSWLGTFSSIFGAFLMAFGYVFPAYLGFTLGAAIWFGMGLLANDKPLITLNATFFVANIIGLYRAFL
jgi:hypothetical protein